MRVISGKVRGLKLDCPQGIETRPTLDRVKEAVFSMLLPYIADSSVLDLYAGSGALGIEALSRGADSAVFIDNSETACNCIKSNLSKSKLDAQSTVLKTSAEQFLKSNDRKFDIIFLDPPYSKNMYSNALKLISEYRVLSDNGIILAEWDYEIGFTKDLSDFAVVKEKKYGRVGVSVLKWG